MRRLQEWLPQHLPHKGRVRREPSYSPIPERSFERSPIRVVSGIARFTSGNLTGVRGSSRSSLVVAGRSSHVISGRFLDVRLTGAEVIVAELATLTKVRSRLDTNSVRS